MSLSKSFFAILLMAGAVTSAQQQPPAPPPAPPQPPAPVPRILQAYKSVTTERLKKPEDNDWLMIRRTYNGWGHSPLKQITTGNVNKLQPVWVMSTGMPSGHEAPPIVNNGVMFVSTPGNQVIAVDAKAGTVLWRYTKAAGGRMPSSFTGPAAASRCTATKCSSPPPTRCSSRST